MQMNIIFRLQQRKMGYMQRRKFLESIIIAQSLITFQTTLKGASSSTDYWLEIRNQFPICKTDHINLNNGSCGMTPLVVEESLFQLSKEMNRTPPYIKNEMWKEQMETNLSKLADLIGVEASGLSITRNTTESLQWLIDGIMLPKNSIVVCANHDYSLAVNALKCKSVNSGLEIRKIDLELPLGSEDIISAYKNAIDDNCSLVLLTAMTHREGHRMPIKEITEIAHEKGAKVLVDGAHCIGHYDHNVRDWNCDYYATSLHKWFNGPHGSGLLYIKESEMDQIEGPLAADINTKTSKKKFEYLGTRAFYIEASIQAALSFNEEIGIKNKYLRLSSLNQYWTENATKMDGVNVTRCKDSGGIALLSIDGFSGSTLRDKFKENKIYVKSVSSKAKKKSSLRITPGIYTNYDDLNYFIENLEKIVKER